MINRKLIIDIQESLSYFPIVAIIGPRQVGKTTLAKSMIEIIEKKVVYLDLELDSDRFKLENAELFFSQQTGKLVIIDEIQVKKDLYALLRAIVDKTREPGQFLLLGSASPELLRDSSESLAGRIAYHQLFPLNIEEIGEIEQNDLWIKGGFPLKLLAKSENLGNRWMENFINTYLNRDLLQLGLNASPKTIRSLWMMMAHLNGSPFDATYLAKSLGVTSPTVKRYVEFLEDAFLLKSIYPYSSNNSKRLVKSPKVYLTDTGILHHLIRTTNFEQLSGNPALGNSWEAFVINQLLSLKQPDIELHFYRTHQGAEIDLVFTRGVQILATAEIKYSNSPSLSRGNIQSIIDLNAQANYIITPSSTDFLIKENIRVCSLKTFVTNYFYNL